MSATGERALYLDWFFLAPTFFRTSQERQSVASSSVAVVFSAYIIIWAFQCLLEIAGWKGGWAFQRLFTPSQHLSTSRPAVTMLFGLIARAIALRRLYCAWIKREVVGFAGVAQRLELQPSKLVVEGSNPFARLLQP